MNLDETIQHYQKIADYHDGNTHEHYKNKNFCEENKQLVEWLIELKKYREQIDLLKRTGNIISRKSAIKAMYNMHMNGEEGVIHDLETLTGSACCFSETISDAISVLEELPPFEVEYDLQGD